ncbi:MAG: cation diffusion facilitator family transporter [Pseudomonadota bacterium]
MATLSSSRVEDIGAREARLMRLASYASVAVSLTLIAAKTGAWAVTDSVSVLSSLLDSLFDTAASFVNLLAVRHALVPADTEHRFGHGKIEPLAALAQAAFIGGSALLLFLEAGHRLVVPQPVANGEVGIAVMVFSIALTLGLVLFQRRVVAATKSVTIGADQLHYRGDLLVNLSVIAALVLSGLWSWPALDPLFGAAIGAYVLYSAYAIARTSLDLLMDRELPAPDRERIRAIALGHPEVRDLHDLRTRSAGRSIFIQFHLEMDGGMSLRRAHEISDQVEARVLAVYPHAEIIVHEDPAGVEQVRRTFASG